MSTRQEIRCPDLCPRVGHIRSEYQERRKILIDRPKPITHPSSDAWSSKSERPSVHTQCRVVVIGMARMHRTNKRNVISLVGDVREQITHFNSTLTARRKLPIRSLQEYFLISWTIACLGVIKDDLFTMVFNQFWFRIERIDVRDTSAHEKKNDRLRLRWEMWRLWRERIGLFRRVSSEDLAKNAWHQQRTSDCRSNEATTIGCMNILCHRFSPNRGFHCWRVLHE